MSGAAEAFNHSRQITSGSAGTFGRFVASVALIKWNDLVRKPIRNGVSLNMSANYLGLWWPMRIISNGRLLDGIARTAACRRRP